MKSLMEEASSIAKALEKAWDRAGNPREFTVKVLDKPEKNFFGFTTKSAKVAILFEEEMAQRSQQTSRYPERTQQQPRQQRPATQPQQKRAERPQQERTRRPNQEQSTQHNARQPLNTTQQTSSEQPIKRVHEPVWTPERVAFVRQWIQDMQRTMNCADIGCDISTDRNAIRIVFEKPLAQDPEQEKQLFRSWAYLIMQTLRHTYKQQFKHIKIILKSAV